MATEDARKLFVAGLPESITEDVLRQLFEATGGQVVEVSLPRDRATGNVRGFGFVSFASSEQASHARDLLDGSTQGGRAISVRPFSSEPPKRGERSDMRSESTAPAAPAEDRTLYVGNLPYDTSQQELTQLFTDNGVSAVVRMHLPTGPDGRLRGFGFVTLATPEAASDAVNALRNADVRGRRLMVNIAHPRGAPGGGPSDRSWPQQRPESGRPTEPRFPTEPPMGFEGARPPSDRRARVAPSTEPDWSEEAKKKQKKKGKVATKERSPEARRRGGGSSWQSSRGDWEDDD